ncbi:MAG: hypothetical protein ACOYK8_06960 [Alphaproteobacteria bacterium]
MQAQAEGSSILGGDESGLAVSQPKNQQILTTYYKAMAAARLCGDVALNQQQLLTLHRHALQGLHRHAEGFNQTIGEQLQLYSQSQEEMASLIADKTCKDSVVQTSRDFFTMELRPLITNAEPPLLQENDSN